MDWCSEDFVTVVAVEGAPVEEFVTVLSIGGSPPEGAEEVLVYRLPGERLGFGLKFEGGTSSSEKVRRLFIQSCAPDSPASRACCSWGSLQEGDEVLQIDAVPVTSMTRLDCVRCLKESHVVIKLLVRHSPPPVPPRRKQQQSVLGPPTAFADAPPEAEVYLDLLAQEEEEEMAGLTESESDDTGSSISTVVAPHIDLAKVLSPFEQLERELEADNEETGTPLQPPLSFQDAPLSYGDEKVLPPRPAPRKEFRSGKKRPPPPPPPRTDRPLCPLNVQTIAVVEMDRGDLPRLVDVVPKSVLNCVENRPEQIEGEENPSLVTEYRINGPIEINVQDNILIKTGECAVISDSKNMKYMIDSKENVQILTGKKETGQSVGSCKQNVLTLLDSKDSSSIQTDSNKKTTSKTDADDDNIIIDNQENKPTDSNENRQVIDIKENRLNSTDNQQIESPVTEPEENNLELFSQINIYQDLGNSPLVNENELLETEFEEDSLVIIDNKDNMSVESSSTSDMGLVTQIRVGTPDNLILKQSPIITSTNIVMNHSLTLTAEEDSEIQNPEFAVTKDNFNDGTKLTSLENSSKMPTELSSSQDAKEISELVSTNTNLEHSLEHNPKEDERERPVPPAPGELNTTSPSTLVSIENNTSEHTERSVTEKLEQDSTVCPKEKVKKPSNLGLKEEDKIKCSLALDSEQSSVMKSSTLTPAEEIIEQSLLVTSNENTEEAIRDRPEDKNQAQECESATDGIEELLQLNVKKSMDQFTESSAVKELPRIIRTESNECSKTVEQLQLSSLTKVTTVSPTGDKRKLPTNLNPEEGTTQLSKEDSPKFDKKEFSNIVTSEDSLKEISKNGSTNDKKQSLKFLPGEDSVDDCETFNIKKDLKDSVCHNPTEDKVKLSPKSSPKNYKIQVSNFTMLNDDMKESSTVHPKNNKEQLLSPNSPKDNKEEPLSSKSGNITLKKSPELIEIVDNTMKPVYEFDITDHNIPSKLLTPIKDTNKFIPELVSNDISLKETSEVTFIQEKVRQSQKPFLVEENLKKASLTGLDSIDNYLNKNIKPTSIEGNLKLSPKATSVEDFLENSVKYTTSNNSIEDSPKLISTEENTKQTSKRTSADGKPKTSPKCAPTESSVDEDFLISFTGNNTKQTSKRTSAEGKSKISPKFAPTESSVDEDLLISFTGNIRKQTDKLNLTEVSLKPPSNLTTIEKMIKQSPVLSPRMSSCLDSDTDSETDSDSEDFLLDLPETELLEQGGSVFQPATGALLTASDATFFPFRCWGTSCQLATIGEDDEDSANNQSVPGLSVEEEEEEEEEEGQEEDISNLEQLSATNRLDNLLLKTEVSGESSELSDSEAGPSPPDEEPVAAVTPPSAMEEAPLTSSASRLPPDGHEFPPNYTEHNPFEVGTPVLIELDIEKPPPPLPSVPIPKKISTEEVRSPVRLPSWRKDEKSECSVRDKIAMFSSSGDAPPTPRRQFSSTEDVFRPPPPETLPKPAAPSTLDRTHSSLDLSYTPGQYFSTLPRKPPTSSSSLSRATSFSGGSLQTRSQSLIDIGRGSVEDMRKASLNALIEQRRRGISKLRGLVIPEKVSEVATPSNTICDLPEIRSRDSILSSSKALSQRPNATNRWSVGPSITATTTNSAIPVVMSSPPWKSNNSANLPKYSPAFKRKSLTLYGSTEEPQPLFGNSRHLVESPASLESFTSPTRSDLSFDYKLTSNGKSVLAPGRHCTEDDSDNDSAVSSSRSSISPPPTPPPPPLLSPLRRTLSSETTVSAASSTASTLTCGSSDSNRRVLKAQSVEAINRKNVLSSARYSSGKDVKVGSPLIQRKFEEEEQVACLDEVEGPANEEEEEEDDEQPPVKPLPAPRRAPVPPKPVQRKLLETEPEEETDLLSVLTGNRNQRNRDSLLGDTRRSVSVNDIRKAFEKAEMALANSGRKVNHARVSSLDSTASEDSFTQHYGSVGNLQHEQFGSVTSIASSTSLISPQELQVLIDEANQPLEDFSGTMAMPVHDVVVVVLHREGTTGSVGITLAGGADYEAKEITVHKVLAGSPADRDGRIQKGDRILSINGRSMKGVSHRESLNILKAPRPEVVLVVSCSRGLQDGNNDSQPDDCSVATHIPRPSRPPRIPEQPLETLAHPVSPSQGEDRGPPVTITLTKDGAGLGFSLEGGKDSPLGDKPLTIKKIFTGGSAEKNGQICAGDELLNVNGSDVTVLSRIEAWGLMKRLPDGPVTLTVRHKLK